MSRLEFNLAGQTITIDGVEGERLTGLLTEAMVTVFERLTKGVIGDNEDRFRSPGIRKYIDSFIPETYRTRFRVFPISSESKPWTWYAVRKYDNGVYICPCLGYEHRGHCKHIGLAIESSCAKG
jgi:hypothetical protein